MGGRAVLHLPFPTLSLGKFCTQYAAAPAVGDGGCRWRVVLNTERLMNLGVTFAQGPAMLIISVSFQRQCMCSPREHAGDVFEEDIAHTSLAQ